MTPFRYLTAVTLAAVWMLAAPESPAGAQAPPIPELTVFAASHLGPPFEQIVPGFEKKTHSKVTLVLGPAVSLAKQLRSGAKADVFFAANEKLIDGLVPEGLVLSQGRQVYARGRIVTVTLKASPLRIDSLQDLTDPKVRRIAMADPANGSYGLAAQQALEELKLWNVVRANLMFAESAEQALQLVRSGAADAGIVSRSTVEAPDLSWKLVDTKYHEPINQVAGVVSRTKQPALALAFVEYVDSVQGRWFMRQFGFLLPGEHYTD